MAGFDDGGRGRKPRNIGGVEVEEGKKKKEKKSPLELP